VTPAPVEIYQDSSGGENWQSPVHQNRHGKNPNRFRGYRFLKSGTQRIGARATPILVLEHGASVIAAAMPYFWQNFPKAMEATNETITLRLFPGQYSDLFELQGGEEKTHSFALAFGPDSVTTDPLSWIRSPLIAHAEPGWYCSAGGLPYRTPLADDQNSDYLQLVDLAIEGKESFDCKREVADEYGWRHFGDVPADHEAVFHHGPESFVSHYNNQYDALAGLALQFLRSGDGRWWKRLQELATHVVDIDIYHTTRDRPAYNHGLFWHTCHHTTAGTSTHRSYPRAMGVRGGGPSNMHNYTTGLLLHHFLTGDPRSRQTVIDLASWVIDMDDGNRTALRWLTRAPTGLASATGSPGFHGPGRGAGNSINALLDGHRLTGRAEFLAKAEGLIRRCIHPCDDIAGRQLLDAERRWSYTMFLQALGRYLDHKQDLGTLDFNYAYAQESLLHYARWMADHEIPYLDKPERLEQPTETWAAQDMRKSEVFQYSAIHAAGIERAQFLEKCRFFFRYSVTTLSRMKTRALTRPLVLMLSNGLMYNDVARVAATTQAPVAAPGMDFGAPQRFVPQRHRAVRRAGLLLGLGAIAAVVAYFFH
jgi:hypothetical protein